MTINVQAEGVEMTPALKQYAEEKISGLDKFFDNIQGADVHIGMQSHHHLKGKIYYAHVNLSVPGKVMRVEKDAEDLYKAIDKVRDHFKVEFEKLKGKMRQKDREEIRGHKAYHLDE